MSSLKILVAEDDPLHAARMEMLLTEIGYEMIGPADDEGTLLRLFKATLPDIVILDIRLKGGSDGVDIAARLSQVQKVPLIFATSYTDATTMKRAVAANPFAYLIKPVEKGALQAAIELALFKFGRPDVPSEAFTSWTEDLVIQDFFFVKAGDKLLKVSADDILWVEVAEDRYCDIVTADRRYHLRTSLSSLESKLNTQLFFRTHRTCIVNLRKVDSIDEGDFTISIDGRDVPLGKTFKASLLKRLKTLQ
ncbi:MAG: response regulator transcription factor [Imperialibacter sp.]